MLFCNAQAQKEKNCKTVFVATTEKAMYQLIERLQDSVLQRDYYNEYKNKSDYFDYVYYAIESDTLMQIKIDCPTMSGKLYNNFYSVYLSNKMSVSFYDNLFRYAKKLIESQNLYIKGYGFSIGICTGKIIKEQYKSTKLNKADAVKAKKMIEQMSLWNFDDSAGFSDLAFYDRNDSVFQNVSEYKVTEEIRKELIKAIKNPYYPNYYLDFYMSRQDTSFMDITGIPTAFKEKYNKRNDYSDPTEEKYAMHILYFNRYKAIADYKYGGISPGKAYLEERKDGYRKKGYKNINNIAAYAYRVQDQILIKHLKEFKKKHPDYSLEYF
jgi:hypothetical protein